MNKSLSLSRLGDKWFNQLIQNVVEAGRTISYVETLGNKADTFHLEIKQRGKREFMHEFEKAVRFSIAKLNLKKVKLAFDVTEDKTWMKDSYNIRPSAYDEHLPSWQYLNVSIVDPYFIPIMSIPYTMFSNLDNMVIDLLNYINSLSINVELLLFDRGFYHSHLIDYLNSKDWPYLMLIPQRGKNLKDKINGTKNINYFNHELTYRKSHSKWKTNTTIMIKRIDEDTAYCYATNQKPSLLLIREYTKRWNIETGFRVHDEARIKSKSRNKMIRYFYHLIGMLLIILWRMQNKVSYYVFKKYLKFVEYQFYPDEVKRVMQPP